MTALPRHSNGEESLLTLIQWEKLPMPEREYVFAAPRKFRADFCWPDRMLMVEVDGGGFVGGRHGRGLGMEADCEKASLAAVLGYRVIRVTPRHIVSGKAIEWIRAALGIPSPEQLHRQMLAEAGQ